MFEKLNAGVAPEKKKNYSVDFSGTILLRSPDLLVFSYILPHHENEFNGKS